MNKALIELFLCMVLIVCFWNEEKFIAFEQKIVQSFHMFCSIIRQARYKKIPIMKLIHIFYAAAAEEIKEKIKMFR